VLSKKQYSVGFSELELELEGSMAFELGSGCKREPSSDPQLAINRIAIYIASNFLKIVISWVDI
jgi:hypothetical protein